MYPKETDYSSFPPATPYTHILITDIWASNRNFGLSLICINKEALEQKTRGLCSEAGHSLTQVSLAIITGAGASKADWTEELRQSPLKQYISETGKNKNKNKQMKKAFR